MTDALHITLSQINPIVGDLDYNLDKIRKVRDEAPPHTDLIVLPEMALCGYPPEDLVLKPFFLEKIRAQVEALARESAEHAPWILAPCPWTDSNGTVRNTVHLIGGGKIQSTITKHHLPNYGVFDEVRVFSPGPLPDAMIVKGHRIGVMICEDMWFADVAAHLKANGAELLISINASPYETGKSAQRDTHARNRVAETKLPLIYLNQCGGQDELVFDGASFIMHENGRKILQAEEFVEDIHHTVWERAVGGHWICSTDTTHKLHNTTEAVYQAVMTGLRDYVAKNRFPGVLIGMSGGIDSALAAALATDALGHDAVHCVMMPSRYTSRDSLEDAEECAKLLGVRYDSISITCAVEAFEQELGPHFNKGTPSITHENIQSRSRGLMLMALSNASGKMVLSTGNKSEMAVGYATIYGDMCGGFNVLKDIYKTQVYELANWRNGKRPDHGWGPRGRVIPERIITKAPTAELRENQKDQDSLPPYEVLDDILAGLIEQDLSIEEIAGRGHDPALVRKVWRMLDGAEYKRRQAPPGVKITSRAFGRDRRYPIVNHFTKMIEESR